MKRSLGKKKTLRKSRKTKLPVKAKESAGDSEVDRFIEAMDHPLKSEVELLRRIILGVSPAISEGIKWNSPSFKTSDWFATVNLRGKGGQERVWLILHTGARTKGKTMQDAIKDPAGLFEWLAKDRCLVTFADGGDLRKKRAVLEAVLKQWIARL